MTFDFSTFDYDAIHPIKSTVQSNAFLYEVFMTEI